ncbi:MAG: type II toxin-antitoxin system VapC family toxin [Betaproteobacteria bacterium]|jgi:predicted nucleic acid-binding protein
MRITIDASAVLSVVCNEPGRELAIKLTKGHALIAPSSLHWEMGNALSAMLKRQRITLTEAKACLAAYAKIPIKLIDVDIKRALAISSKCRVYAYDAYMLVCAQQSGSPLLTFDEALWAHASELGIEVLGDGV